MKCKAYSDEFKEQVLKEAIETGNMTLVARNNNVPATTVYSWTKKRKIISQNIISRGPNSNNFNSNNHNKDVEKENDTL